MHLSLLRIDEYNFVLSIASHVPYKVVEVAFVWALQAVACYWSTFKIDDCNKS